MRTSGFSALARGGAAFGEAGRPAGLFGALPDFSVGARVRARIGGGLKLLPPKRFCALVGVCSLLT